MTKHGIIWCIAKEGWVGFYCFLKNIFQIIFKYLQNIVILWFQKFTWEKYHMLREHENGGMVALQNDFLLYILKCTWIEKSDICWQKFLTSVILIKRSTSCNVRLNIVMKQWKYKMARILNCRAIFLQIWKH